MPKNSEDAGSKDSMADGFSTESKNETEENSTTNLADSWVAPGRFKNF